MILINQHLSRSIWLTIKNHPPLKRSWLQANSLAQAVTVLFGSATDHQLVSPCIMKARSLQWVPKLYCSCLELVKEWVGKIHPSFLQTLHISPILDKLTEPSYIAQQKLFNRNARNRQVMIFSRKSLFLGKNIYIIAIRIYGGGYLQR